MADLTQTEELAWRIVTWLSRHGGERLEVCAEVIDHEIRAWLAEQAHGELPAGPSSTSNHSQEGRE